MDDRLLDYDEVMDRQRKAVYSNRQKILRGENLKEDFIWPWMEEFVNAVAGQHIGGEYEGDEGIRSLQKEFEHKFNIKVPLSQLAGERDAVAGLLKSGLEKTYQQRERGVGPELMRRLERYVMLQKLDEKWKDHLYFMDILRANIGLEAYAQKDPKVQYIIKGSQGFEEMLASWQDEVIELTLRVKLAEEEEEVPESVWNITGESGTEWSSEQAMREAAMDAASGEEHRPEPIRVEKKVGRNDPCPCGSGKKYKKCCGRSQ